MVFSDGPNLAGTIVQSKNPDSVSGHFPAGPGTYALVLKCENNEEIAIGKLGRFRTQPGYYVYVGSAFGPGGLRARIGHHLRSSSKPHWHIDYLKQFTEIIEICFSSGMERFEHRWAAILQSQADAVIPFPRFGASDCDCPAHLFFFEYRPGISLLLKPGGERKCCESVILR